MLERKEERVKAVRSSEKGSNVRVWRTRDRGDLSYWDQLRSVSDEAMRQWCDNAKQQIKQVDQGHNVSEGIWSKWLECTTR